jgi:8-oxo-dGTP pyrophosphatase MutT (NUDIX family)
MKARSAALAVIDTGKEWVLQRRENKDGIWWPGKIGCWGGHVESYDESADTALLRELFEELELAPSEMRVNILDTLTEDFTEKNGSISRLKYHYYEVVLKDPARFLHVYEGEGLVRIPYDADFSDTAYSFAPNAMHPLRVLQERRRNEA